MCANALGCTGIHLYQEPDFHEGKGYGRIWDVYFEIGSYLFVFEMKVALLVMMMMMMMAGTDQSTRVP